MGFFIFLLLVMAMPLILVPLCLLPVLLYLKSKTVKYLWVYLAAGAVTGFLLGLIFSYSFFALSGEFNSYYAYLTLGSILVGVSVSFLAGRSALGVKVV